MTEPAENNKLYDIYKGIIVPSTQESSSPAFVVQPVITNYFIGKDSSEHVCFLIRSDGNNANKSPPIQLMNLDVQFELKCLIRDDAANITEGRFTVLRCRSHEEETIRYFLSICNILMRRLGNTPSRNELASAIRRIASIFQHFLNPPVRSLNGLFGELLLIYLSSNTHYAVEAWHVDNQARFDFSFNNIRLEVKTSAKRTRIHNFTFEQCNAPKTIHAIVASIMVERIPNGLSIGDMIESIEKRISSDSNLALKFHEVIVSTLGSSLTESYDKCFDFQLAESSIEFYDLHEIPAIRGKLQLGVSQVSFASDLAGQTKLSRSTLIKHDTVFGELLPKK